MRRFINKLRTMGIIGIQAFCIYRIGNFIYFKIKIPGLRHILWFLYYVLDIVFVRIFAHAEIAPECKIGKGVNFVHGANGVIISGGTVIHNNVTIYHQTTIGVVNNKKGSPVIEDDVFIGAGAKILGPIKIGKGAKIGANAVVLCDVPEFSTAVGIPAKIKNVTNKIIN